MRKAAAYGRYSSDNQREESIDAQLRAIKEYCSKNDIVLTKVYADEARSATTDDRPQFLDMIEDSSKGMFDVLIVHKLDRFARNRYDSAFYKKKLKDNGVQVISVLEQLDDSPESIILESVLEGMAEYYSKNLAREVMKGMKETALQAKHCGGTPPLGFDVDKEKNYIINEVEADIVRKIFKMYLEGYGYAKIAEELNNSGRFTKTKNAFSKNSIRDILLNEKYIGTYVFNKRLNKNTNTKYKPADQIIKIPNALPRIIEDESFEKVQSKMKNNVRGPRMKDDNVYILTGKIKCGECGASYIGNSYRGGRNGKKYYLYACVQESTKHSCNNKPIRKDLIEKYVVDELKNNVFADNVINDLTTKILTYLKTRKDDSSKEMDYINENLSELQKKLDKTFDAYYDGVIDKTILGEKIDRLKFEIDLFKNRKLNIEAQDYSWLNHDKIKAYLLNAKDNLENGDAAAQQKVINTFVNSVIVYNDYFEVTYKLDPFENKNPLSSSDIKSNAERGKVGGGEPRLTITLAISRKNLYKLDID